MRLDIPGSSPEWQFYAVLAPLVTKFGDGDKILSYLATQFTAVRVQIDGASKNAPKPIMQFVVAPTAAAAMYVAIVAIASISAALAAWGYTRALDDANFAAQGPRAAAMLLTTPGGQAASKLLKANGDGLAVEIQHCKHFIDHGRDAILCSFWNQGSFPAHVPSAFDRVLALIASVPAWPLVAIAIPVVLVAYLRTRPRVKYVK